MYTKKHKMKFYTFNYFFHPPLPNFFLFNQYYWITINFTHLKCTGWWALTDICICETTTRVKIQNMPNTPKRSLSLPLAPGNQGSVYQYRSVCIFWTLYKWNHTCMIFSYDFFPSTLSLGEPFKLLDVTFVCWFSLLYIQYSIIGICYNSFIHSIIDWHFYFQFKIYK